MRPEPAAHLSRRRVLAAGAVGLGLLALRPHRSLASLLASPFGDGTLVSAVRTDRGILGLVHQHGSLEAIAVDFAPTTTGSVHGPGTSDRGPVTRLERIDPWWDTSHEVLSLGVHGGAVIVAGHGGRPRPVPPISLAHLPERARLELEHESDSPLVGAMSDPGQRWQPWGMGDDGTLADVSGVPDHGVLVGVSDGWVISQHAPTDEGDHLSELSVARGGERVLHVVDLGDAGQAMATGAADDLVVGCDDGRGVLRSWHVASGTELPGLDAGDRSAVAARGTAPVAIHGGRDGLWLSVLSGSGWSDSRSVHGSTSVRRVLPVGGPGAPTFLLDSDRGLELLIVGDQ